VALGALHALTIGIGLAHPRDCIVAALSAAEAHNIGVRHPFIIEVLPHPQAPAPAASKRAR
jgi:hypothetical protein